MLRFLILTLLLLVGSAGAALAQGLVESSMPADGDAGVALSTTVSITFTAPIDADRLTTEDGVPAFAIGVTPVSKVQLDPSAYSLSNDNRTLSFTVIHEPDTDYALLVLGVPLEGGGRQLVPYVANYTTAAEIGPFSVSGQVAVGEGVETELEGVIGTVVALYQSDVLGDDETDVDPADVGELSRVAIVSDPGGAYSIPYVRDGVYNAVAIRTDVLTLLTQQDLNLESDILVGFYNPDADLVPDPFTVEGSDVDGIDITLLNFLTTARTAFSYAQSVAADFPEDADLYEIVGGFLVFGESVGRSPIWLYGYYSAALDELYEVGVALIGGGGVDTLQGPDIREGQLPIPDDFVDSDVAMAVAEANGGAAFRAYVEAGHDGAGKAIPAGDGPALFDVFGRDFRALVDPTAGSGQAAEPQSHSIFTTFLTGGHHYWTYPLDPTPSAPVFWRVDYVNIDFNTFRFDSLSVFVDMVTGDLLYVEGGVPVPVEDESLPQSVRLRQNYPNPFNPSTTIVFELDRPMTAELAVYDALGRRIATLADGLLAAGSHAVSWRPDPERLASGVYLYRLRTPDGVQVRRMILQQ